MDFYDAKENIQPLASGRDASILQASIVHSPQELLEQRRELEASIHAYNGTDPLDPWYNYIKWIEQSFPSGGKESGLMQVLSKCLRRFESEDRYYQDRRMIKLFIKFMDSQKDSTECYQQLYNAGIGTMVADFYIAWAYCLDSVGQTRKADEIFRRGIECHAQPLDDLKEAHQHFGFSIAQRTLYKDDEDALESAKRQIEERRSALSSLRGYRGRTGKGEIGSIRTGVAIKSLKPGTVQVGVDSTRPSSSNTRVAVLTDENASPNIENGIAEFNQYAMEESVEIQSAAVVRSIVDKARHQENEREPGPWNKVHDKNNTKKLLRQKKIAHDLGFNIHEDNGEESENSLEKPNEDFQIILNYIELYERNYDKPFKFPTNFVSKNSPQPEWILPITTECQPDPHTIPQYNKCMTYPRPNREFQSEELCAYLYFKRRNIQNAFTQRYNSVWGNDITVPIRLYPNFARESKIQSPDEMDKFFVPTIENGEYMVPLKKLYDEEKQEEFQNEELMKCPLLNSGNDTVMAIVDMDETMCTNSNDEQVQRRKSFFPVRRSLAVRSVIAAKLPIESSTAYKTSESQTKLPEITENQSIPHTSCVPIDKSHIKDNKEKPILPSLFQFEEQKDSLTMTEESISEKNETLNEQRVALPVSSKANADDFNFKTPALPIKPTKLSPEVQISVQPLNKLPFEIYVEENTETVATGIFDAEETCTTQAFNNFIKSQSASTPKAAQRMIQKRQFGVLLDVPTTIPTSTVTLECTPPTQTATHTVSLSVANEDNVLSPVLISNSPTSPDVQSELPTNSYSPLLRKQLSTILETSEHATTQGTHSTAVSTKSTNGSQESDFADAAVNASENVFIQQANAHTHTTIRETSCQWTKDVVDPMRDVHITTSTSSIQRLIPSPTRKQEEDMPTKVVSSPQKFVIYVDDTESETWPQLPKAPLGNDAAAGNFERMVQREDTASSCFAVYSSLRFQDDKTETITKFPAAQVFPEDRTTTIPKIHDSMFSYEPQALAITPTRLDLTTLSTQQKAVKTNTSNASSMIPTLPKTSVDHINIEDEKEDSFEFFRKSPIKPLKSAAKVGFNQLHIRTEATNALPLPKSNSEKTNSQMELMKFFENEMMNVDEDQHIVSYSNQSQKYADEYFQKPSSKQVATKISENLLTENSRCNMKKMENNLGISFLPEISLIGETPSQTKDDIAKSSKTLMQMSQTDETHSKFESYRQANKEHMNKKNDSVLPESSFIAETQSFEIKNKNKTIQQSMLQSNISDYSFIKETQEPRNNATLKSKQDIYGPPINQGNKSNDIKTIEQKSILALQNSFLPDFSLVEGIEPIKETSQMLPNRNSSLTTSLNVQDPQTNRHQISNNIPKEVISEKRLKDSKIPQRSALRLRQSEAEKAEMIGNDSFIPETQELQSKSSHFSQTRHTKSNNYFQNSLLSNTKNDGSCSANTLKESSQLSVIAKGSNQQCYRNSKTEGNETIRTLEKSLSNNDNNSTSNSSRIPIFEVNAETEMFSTGISMIKNSTMLSRSSMIQPQAQTCTNKNIEDHSWNSIQNKNDWKLPVACEVPNTHNQCDADQEMSIYFKCTPRTPLLKIHNKSWPDAPEDNGSEEGYLYHEIDLDETTQRIQVMRMDKHVNPFNVDLLNSFLDSIDFVNFLNNSKTTMFVGRTPRLTLNSVFNINEIEFKVTKLIGEGAYGIVYRGVEKKSGKECAFKQERPPNYWEYYISLEVQSRIEKDEILSAYMNIDYALIGNNASIFVSSFSSYGSIINVCNKIKKHTQKNVDEYVVMHLTCELLEIIDHLHAARIIHADVKADNFLLMRKLIYNNAQPSLQLIDFGVSIDMKHFEENQNFTYVHNDNAFKCVEMRENRPWSYQLDLYGLAGVIHVMLFGKFMDIEKRPEMRIWMPKTHMPRYINKLLWESIFRSLLNVRDCKSMPNLQTLRSLIKEEMAEKERFVIGKLAEFNKALDA